MTTTTASTPNLVARDPACPESLWHFVAGGGATLPKPFFAKDEEGAGRLHIVMAVLIFGDEYEFGDGTKISAAPGAFAASISALNTGEAFAYLYSDGNHLGLIPWILGSTEVPWGQEGSLRFWEDHTGEMPGLYAGCHLAQTSAGKDVSRLLRKQIIRRVSIGSWIDESEEVERGVHVIRQAQIRESSFVAKGKFPMSQVVSIEERPAESQSAPLALAAADSTTLTAPFITYPADKDELRANTKQYERQGQDMDMDKAMDKAMAPMDDMDAMGDHMMDQHEMMETYFCSDDTKAQYMRARKEMARYREMRAMDIMEMAKKAGMMPQSEDMEEAMEEADMNSGQMHTPEGVPMRNPMMSKDKMKMSASVEPEGKTLPANEDAGYNNVGGGNQQTSPADLLWGTIK